MYITKDKIENIKRELNLDENIRVYVDLRFYLKDLNNPAFDYTIKYYGKKDLKELLQNVQKYLSTFFNAPTHLIYSTNKIYINELPNYKSDYYRRYIDDGENLQHFIEAFKELYHTSITNGDEMFIDPSFSGRDELEFIKDHHKDDMAIVISRETIFDGYSDMILITPKEISKGILKERETLEYNKIVLSLSGYESYSLEKVAGIGVKRANRIISKLIDNDIYIYYNNTSEKQLVFPISFENLAGNYGITRKDYEDIILPNWRYLNR